jgi:hypothetical protein
LIIGDFEQGVKVLAVLAEAMFERQGFRGIKARVMQQMFSGKHLRRIRALEPVSHAAIELNGGTQGVNIKAIVVFERDQIAWL